MKSPLLFSSTLPDNLKTFRNFEIILAGVCITIPLLLRLADHACGHFRSSISAYFDIKNAYLFGMLMCIPAMLFMFNGAVYFRRELPEVYDWRGKWYNIGLGFCLLMVICFNCKEHNKIHTFFAGIFFFGNAVVMAFGGKIGDHVVLRRCLALLTVAAVIFGYCRGLLFWGEWISLIVIGAHFILVAEGIIQMALLTQNSETMI